MSKQDHKNLKVGAAQNKRLQRLKRSDGNAADGANAMMTRQGSAESSYSQPSSDPSLDDDGTRQRIQYNEQTVLQALDNARTTYVEFTLRANVAYDGSNEPDVPLRGRAISFSARDFIFVKAKFNEEWWIGQLVREAADVGFVPTPSKLNGLTRRRAKASTVVPPAGAPNASGTPPNAGDAPAAATPAPPAKSGVKGKTSNSVPPSRDAKTDTKANVKIAPPTTNSVNSVNDDGSTGAGGKTADADAEPGASTPAAAGSAGAGTGTGPRGAKKGAGAFFRKSEMQAPYEVVPNMRPVMLLGPSLKGYDVTDMMQKAVFSRVKERLGDRVQILRVKVDLTLAKRAAQTAAGTSGNSSGTGQRRGLDKVARSLGVQVADVQAEVETIFQAARLMRLIIVDCDTINHPSQLPKTGLAPLAVHLKIGSAKVLQRLIKTRGKDRKNLSVQVTALENLNKCPPDSFDLMLDDNQFDSASHRLVDFLETYWRATHPPSMFGGATDPVEQLRHFDEVHRPRMEKRDRERDAFSAANREQLLASAFRDPTARAEGDGDPASSDPNAPSSSNDPDDPTAKRRPARSRAPGNLSELDEEASATGSGSSSTHTQLTSVSGAASRRASAQAHVGGASLRNAFLSDDAGYDDDDPLPNAGRISLFSGASQSQRNNANATSMRRDTDREISSVRRTPAAAPRFDDEDDDEFMAPSGTHLVASRGQPETTRSGSIVV